ncbi:MAG: Ferredoxin [Myxococcales bacterium]|nr:Ferredoxin [Myxococcales bacterium]
MIESAIDALAEAGFDVVHRFDAVAAAHEPGLARIGDPRRRLGLLVGNTRALWPRFTAAIDSDAELVSSAHPLERYTEQVVDRIASTMSGATCWFAHREYDGVFLPFQRLAVATGLGSLAPTQLVIHPIYGPWFALRAVIACAGDAPITPLSSRACMCEDPCSAAFRVADAATGTDAWRAWLAVRDACSAGRAFRYSDEQIAYHYTKDRSVLVSNTGKRTPLG